LPDELVAGVAKLFFCLQVQKHDLTVLIDDDHGVGRCLQEPAVLCPGFLAFGQVAAELGKAAQVSSRVAQSRGGDARHEQRAILAHAHALFLVLTAPDG